MSVTTSERAPGREILPDTASTPKSELFDRLPALPDDPLVVIQAGKARIPLNLRDVWVYRELLYFLVQRELKVRYKQTVLGVLWVVLQPLLMTLIFTVVLGRLARVPSGQVPYGLFVYIGLTAWTFISTAITNCAGSLVGNSNLITKVYFPRIIVPTAAIVARLVDLVIAFVILAGLMLWYGVTPTRALLFLPVPVVLMTLFSWGVGVWLSALNVKYRDINMLLPLAIQLMMFLAPVVYPITLVPAKWQRLYALNPLVGIIESFRASLLNGLIPWWALMISIISTGVLLACGAYAFSRMEKTFADLI